MKRTLLCIRIGSITDEAIEEARALGDYLIVAVLMDGYKSRGDMLRALGNKAVGDIIMVGSIEEAVRISAPDVYTYLGQTREMSKEAVDSLILHREVE